MNYAADLIVGRNLRMLREDRGVPSATLAAMAGIPAADLHAYEEGEARLSPAVIAALGAALNVPISALFEGCPEPEPPAAPRERRLN